MGSPKQVQSVKETVEGTVVKFDCNSSSYSGVLVHISYVMPGADSRITDSHKEIFLTVDGAAWVNYYQKYFDERKGYQGRFKADYRVNKSDQSNTCGNAISVEFLDFKPKDSEKEPKTDSSLEGILLGFSERKPDGVGCIALILGEVVGEDKGSILNAVLEGPRETAKTYMDRVLRVGQRIKLTEHKPYGDYPTYRKLTILGQPIDQQSK